MKSEIFVEVIDTDGSPLPGATGTITSPVLPGARTAISDARGRMHFLDLAPGDYALAVEMTGFEPYREDDIPVRNDTPCRLRAVLQLENVA